MRKLSRVEIWNGTDCVKITFARVGNSEVTYTNVSYNSIERLKRVLGYYGTDGLVPSVHFGKFLIQLIYFIPRG